jgi:hypothetical protein
VEVTRPGFRRPAEDPPPTSWAPGSAPDADASSGSSPDSGPDVPPLDPEVIGAAATSSPGSIAEALFPLITTGVLAGMAVVHRIQLRRRQGLDTGAWHPQPEPAADIAAPLARIAERHAPAGVGATGDLGDVIEAGSAAITWSVTEAAKEAAFFEGAHAGAVPTREAPEPAPAPPSADVAPPQAATPSSAGVRGNAAASDADLAATDAKRALFGAHAMGPLR